MKIKVSFENEKREPCTDSLRADTVLFRYFNVCVSPEKVAVKMNAYWYLIFYLPSYPPRKFEIEDPLRNEKRRDPCRQFENTESIVS